MLQLLIYTLALLSDFQLVLAPCAVEWCEDNALGAAVLHQCVLSAVKGMFSEQLLFSVGSHYSSVAFIVNALHVLVQLSLVTVAFVAGHVLIGEVLADSLLFLFRENLDLETLFVSFL